MPSKFCFYWTNKNRGISLRSTLTKKTKLKLGNLFIYTYRSGKTNFFESKRKYVEYLIESDRQSDARISAWIYSMSKSNNG